MRTAAEGEGGVANAVQAADGVSGLRKVRFLGVMINLVQFIGLLR